jgi:hypothetical protein
MSAFGTRNFVVTYTVAQSFSFDGRSVVKGEVLSKDDPVVPAVLKERPDLLHVRLTREEPPKYA